MTEPVEPLRSATSARHGGLGRLVRLARKELRETLRDRRTLVTLVLMPLLVYPVLSLAFQQFVLSSFQQTGELQWFIGAESQEEIETLSAVLNYSEHLAKPDSRSVPRDQQPLPKLPGAGAPAAELTLSNATPQVVPKLEEAVREMTIDLGVRIKKLPGDDDLHVSRKRYDFEVIYRASTPLSRQAAEFVERRLRAINDADRDERLRRAGITLVPPAAWKLQSVDGGEGETYWLATLVPLVLILMTITGAVYPAIDLTAGERERGTLEALMAAPIPRMSLLVAKFVAVLSVALLTAVVNLVAMALTMQSSGLASLVFGERGLTFGAVAAVFGLLVLFATFFSALLLTVTSFARSFKEAQAYLIPLVMLSLGPGFLSLMPGLSLNGGLAVTPLANIVLLARDVLRGAALPLPAAVAIISTLLYALAALTLAAKVFGSDAILYGSEGSWADVLRRSDERLARPSLAGAALCAAVVYPSYFVVSGLLGLLRELSVGMQLFGSGVVTVLLFAALPMLIARLQHVSLGSGFQLRRASLWAWGGALVLGLTIWPLATEIVLLAQSLQLGTLDEAALKRLVPGVESAVERWRTVSPVGIWLALAIAPAICEELFFRGYLLGALRERMPAWVAIGLTSLLFGFFHLSVGGLMAVERVISSALLGMVLGWICYRTRSVLPGIVMHALHNGLMLSLAYWSPALKEQGFNMEAGQHLPALWLISSLGACTVGLVMIWAGTRNSYFSADAARNTSP